MTGHVNIHFNLHGSRVSCCETIIAVRVVTRTDEMAVRVHELRSEVRTRNECAQDDRAARDAATKP